MIKNIFISVVAAAVGYWFFFAVSFWRRRMGNFGQDYIGKKYLGFKSYAEMRNYVVGANLIWTPILVAMSVLAIVQGLLDAIWAVAFTSGYVIALFRFGRKTRKMWEDEHLPESRL